MYVYSEYHQDFVLDPHMLSIRPFQAIWQKDKTPGKRQATAKILYFYHLFHPKSEFFNKKKKERSRLIIEACFPKELHEEALKWEPYNHPQEATGLDDDMWAALTWYKQNLNLDPYWDSVQAFDQAMYNLNDKLRSESSTASEIRIASNELDDLPKKREKMLKIAESKQAFTLSVKSDKKIRRSERLPSEAKRQGHKTPSP